MRFKDREEMGQRRSGMGRFTWWVAPVTVALVVSTLGPISAGADGGFDDVAGNAHEKSVAALSDLGVFAGTECGEGLFCPTDPIERWVMAVWLVRALGDDVSPGGPSRFTDVDPSAWWAPFVEQLAVLGITLGCKTDPVSYCPQRSVTRGQMASFLVRAFDLPAAVPAGFADTAGGFHEADIDALASAGITVGCKTDPLSYCPQRSVTRGQMATFLHRAVLNREKETVEEDRASRQEISSNIPDSVEATDVVTGEKVALSSLIPGDRAVLLWFWAIW